MRVPEDRLGQRFGNRALGNQPGPRHAGLPGVGEDVARDCLGSQIKIGIGKDELRTFAAEFQRHRPDAGEGEYSP